MSVTIVAELEGYLLIARSNPRSDRFAVVERRAGRLYNCHSGERGSVAVHDLAAVPTIMDEQDWVDLARARSSLEEADARWRDLAERML